MKKFSFSLKTLLWHRETQEERERTELSLRQFRYQTARNQLKSLESKFDETLAEIAAKRASNAEHAEITLYYRYLDRLRLEIENGKKHLLQLEQELQTQREKVIEATKNRKVLDKLKDKKEKEYNLAAERLEQKTIDELVVVRYGNKDR